MLRRLAFLLFFASACAFAQTPGNGAGSVALKPSRVDVRQAAFGAAAGCANAADPGGSADSACAINAAVASAIASAIGDRHGKAVPELYLPNGIYRLSAALRIPCGMHVTGDGPTATILEPMNNGANGITVTGQSYQPDGQDCEGSLSNIAVDAPTGHLYTATEIELVNATGYRLDNVRVAGGGGRGISLQGNTERVVAHNIEIDAVRWPLLWLGNENHLFKLNISSPGESGDHYCFGTANCPNGIYPGYKWRRRQVIAGISGDGTKADVMVHGGNDGESSNGVSPLAAGHWFQITGLRDMTALNGFSQVVLVRNHTPAPDEYTLTVRSPATGKSAAEGATFKPAILPDRNAAVTIAGADPLLEGGSIKSLWVSGCFQALNVFGGRIADFYCEGYPVNGQPHVNSSLVESGLPNTTRLTSALGADNVAAVESTQWFTAYVNDPRDLGSWSEQVVLFPQDYLQGSQESSRFVPGVLRGQFELMNAQFSGDGKAHLSSRNLGGSTAPAHTAWPAGSLLADFQPNSYSALAVVSNHFSSVDAPRRDGNWTAYCEDDTANVCAEVIAGNIPNGLSSRTLAGGPSRFGQRAFLDLRDVEWWGVVTPELEPYGQGYVKVRGYGADITVSGAGVKAGRGEDANAVNGSFSAQDSAPGFVNVREADGYYPWTSYHNLNSGLSFVQTQQYFIKNVNAVGDPVLGTNPGMHFSAGRQFETSNCDYDLPPVGGNHAMNRWCEKGGPGLTGAQAGWEYDTWNGSAWVVAGAVNGNGDAQFRSLKLANGERAGAGGAGSPDARAGFYGEAGGPSSGPSGGGSGAGPGSILGQQSDGSAPAAGFPLQVMQTAVPDAAGAIADRPLVTVPATGQYVVTETLLTTTAGRDAGVVDAGRVGAGRVVAGISGAAMEGGAPLSCETEPLELARTGASTSRQCAFLLQAGASLSFHAVATGAAGDGRYSLMITVTRLQ